MTHEEQPSEPEAPDVPPQQESLPEVDQGDYPRPGGPPEGDDRRIGELDRDADPDPSAEQRYGE